MTVPHTPVSEQLPASRESRLRILIVGAGIAGLTLAALLQRQGIQPVLIERHHDPTIGGYMLGLLPLGGGVLHGLGQHAAYRSVSQPMRHYELRSATGRLINRYPLERIVHRYGDYQGITRGALAGLLCDAMTPARMALGTTVTDLRQHGEEVAVAFSDGSQARFDLVVGADGLHSEIRARLLRRTEYRYRDTGWGGWVTWARPGDHAMDTYTECWGNGYLLGLYPVKGAVAGFVGGPRRDVERLGRAGFAEKVASRLGHEGLAADLLEPLKTDSDPFFWALEDCHSQHWHKGRVALLGDAAAGFLPTAGVGASMAMQSAAALNDELSRTGPATLEQALKRYQRRQRPPVEAAQKNSRQLARLMMMRSRPLTTLRDWMARFYSLDAALKGIIKVMEGVA